MINKINIIFIMKNRPTSASTATTFGSVKSPKNLSMNPKVSNYYNNGGGRDSYIGVDNGGFSKTSLKSPKIVNTCNL